MGRVIIRVPLNEQGDGLYITDYNDEKTEVSYRTNRNPKNKVTEKIIFNQQMCYTNLFNFHENYLVNFIKSNA